MTRIPTGWTTLFAAVVATSAAACASTAPGRSVPDADRAGAYGGDAITTTDLARLDPGLSVMDALKRLAPSFLRPHGSVPTVSIDGSTATDLSVLQTIRVVEVREIRLLRGAVRGGPATIRSDGAVVVGDVILVVIKKGLQ